MEKCKLFLFILAIIGFFLVLPSIIKYLYPPLPAVETLSKISNYFDHLRELSDEINILQTEYLPIEEYYSNVIPAIFSKIKDVNQVIEKHMKIIENGGDRNHNELDTIYKKNMENIREPTTKFDTMIDDFKKKCSLTFEKIKKLQLTSVVIIENLDPLEEMGINLLYYDQKIEIEDEIQPKVKEMKEIETILNQLLTDLESAEKAREKISEIVVSNNLVTEEQFRTQPEFMDLLMLEEKIALTLEKKSKLLEKTIPNLMHGLKAHWKNFEQLSFKIQRLEIKWEQEYEEILVELEKHENEVKRLLKDGILKEKTEF